LSGGRINTTGRSNKTAGSGLSHGVKLDEFCDAASKELIISEETAIGFGPTANLIPSLSGKPIEEIFKAGADRFPVKIY
jgi:uncharacterized oxidoreductase